MEYQAVLKLLSCDAASFAAHVAGALADSGMDELVRAEDVVAVLPQSLDLVCGLLCLCGGPVQRRLVAAFSLLDHDDDGLLSKRQVWRLVRSMLAVCALVNRDNTHGDARAGDTVVVAAADGCHRIRREADERAAQLVFAIFLDYRKKVAVGELLAWYREQGYLSLPPLELRDGLGTDMGVGDESFARDEAQEDADSSGVVFQGSFPAGRQLTLTAAASAAVRAAAWGSGVYACDLLETLHLLHCLASPEGLLARRGLLDGLRALLPTPAQSTQPTQLIEAVASLVFGDSSDDSLLPFPAVAAGISVLCRGSKSNKLSIGFQLFDGDQDGRLTEEELSAFLSSYLHVLAYSAAPPRRDSEESFAWVGEVCAQAAHNVLQHHHDCSSRTSRATVDFAEFSAYYNGGGYRSLGWIELIDLTKWTTLERDDPSEVAEPVPVSVEDNLFVQPDTRFPPAPSPEEYFSDQDDQEDTDDDESLAFALSLYHTPSTIHSSSHAVADGDDGIVLITRYVSKVSAWRVCGVAWRAGLQRCRPAQLLLCLLARADDGLIALDSYSSALTQLLIGECRASQSAAAEALSYLELLFHAVDYTDEGFADVPALACALSVLCGGGKSDKLAFAFALFSEDDEDSSRQELSRRGLYVLLRSLFWSIWTLALCDETSVFSGDGRVYTAQEESAAMERTALLLCDDILLHAHNRAAAAVEGRRSAFGRVVGFDDLAEWYASRGFKLAPWLELLDLNKWKHLAS